MAENLLEQELCQTDMSQAGRAIQQQVGSDKEANSSSRGSTTMEVGAGVGVVSPLISTALQQQCQFESCGTPKQNLQQM